MSHIHITKNQPKSSITEKCYDFAVQYVKQNNLSRKIDKEKVKDFISYYNNKEEEFKTSHTWQDALSYRIREYPSMIFQSAHTAQKKATSKSNPLLKINTLQEFKAFCQTKQRYSDFYQELSIKFWKEANQDPQVYNTMMQNCFAMIKKQIRIQKTWVKMENYLRRELKIKDSKI
ncbi:hypothetical protein HHU12_21350 [Flammeovirga aprica JL-4]|uniref:Uncharacterized protein n=2 Tax=Flammeovirga aprica TaxID=29528 RepID=A0A7X9RXI1_9BACT|nr:hypothetical protein [Flammeovirga aprica JL-4]